MAAYEACQTEIVEAFLEAASHGCEAADPDAPDEPDVLSDDCMELFETCGGFL